MSAEGTQQGEPSGPAARVQRISSVGEEVIERAELEELLARGDGRKLRCYDGFEPSGRIHIAQGLLKAINTNRLLSAGVDCVFYVADWFAYMNNKCGKDLEKIKKLGRYFIEVWRASGMRGIEGSASPGVKEGVKEGAEDSVSASAPAPVSPPTPAAHPHGQVSFVWASDFIRKNSERYWTRAMDVARQNSVPRMQRCSTIMGRDAGDAQPISQVLYPAMQATDVFELGVDLVEMGLDQRKVNVLAREYADHSASAGEDYRIQRKPVILMHHMLKGLVGPKMSKSVKGSAIFMDDSPADVFQKIWGAKCEPGDRESAILEYYKYIVFAAASEGMLARCGYSWGDIAIRSPTAAELEAAEAFAKTVGPVVEGAEALAASGASTAPTASASALFSKVVEEGVTVASLRAGLASADCEERGPSDSAPALPPAPAPALPSSSSSLRPSVPPPALFSSYAALEDSVAAQAVTPAQLKASLVDYLQMLVAPVSRHFASSPELSRLLEEVREIRQTR